VTESLAFSNFSWRPLKADMVPSLILPSAEEADSVLASLATCAIHFADSKLSEAFSRLSSASWPEGLLAFSCSEAIDLYLENQNYQFNYSTALESK